MRLKSVRSRMTAAFALAFAALILVFGGFVLWFARHTMEHSADVALQTAAIKIASDYEDAQEQNRSPQKQKEQRENAVPRRMADNSFSQDTDQAGWLDDLNELPQQNLALVIVDGEGRVTPKTPGEVPAWPHPDRQQWRIRTLVLGGETVVLGFSWQKVEHTLQWQALLLLALSLMLFLTATFGVWILVGRTLSPIYGLSIQAEAASMDNLRIHLNAPSQDTEIVHLVRTLNALLSRLVGAVSARVRFYAAASHELRTPLQTLTGYLELALMRPRSAEEYHTALEEAYGQSKRLTGLVEAVLLLNQLEGKPVRGQERVNLNEACDQWMREFAPLAEARHLHFAVCPSESIFISATPSHLHILLRNLLENAVKYATLSSEVQVCVETTPGGTGGTWLTIFNHCPFSPDWDAAKLYEPFYRPDASRHSETGGNGLGLAICKAIADANGWNLSIRQQADGVQAKVEFG